MHSIQLLQYIDKEGKTLTASHLLAVHSAVQPCVSKYKVSALEVIILILQKSNFESKGITTAAYKFPFFRLLSHSINWCVYLRYSIGFLQYLIITLRTSLKLIKRKLFHMMYTIVIKISLNSIILTLL